MDINEITPFFTGFENVDTTLVLCAIGLAMVLEGLPYFLMAEKMPEFLLFLASRPAMALRMMGLAMMLGGLLLIFIARH